MENTFRKGQMVKAKMKNEVMQGEVERVENSNVYVNVEGETFKFHVEQLEEVSQFEIEDALCIKEAERLQEHYSEIFNLEIPDSEEYGITIEGDGNKDVTIHIVYCDKRNKVAYSVLTTDKDWKRKSNEDEDYCIDKNMKMIYTLKGLSSYVSKHAN